MHVLFGGQEPSDPPSRPARNSALIAVLRVLLFAEAALVIGVAVWFLIELLTAEPASFTSAIAIFVIVVIAAVFVTAIAIGALRDRPWIRGRVRHLADRADRRRRRMLPGAVRPARHRLGAAAAVAWWSSCCCSCPGCSVAFTHELERPAY